MSLTVASRALNLHNQAMKRLPYFLLTTLLGVATSWASQGNTSVELEMHNSTSSLSPAAGIKSSTSAVVANEESDSDAFNRLTLQLKSPADRTRLKAVDDLGAMGPKSKPDLPALTLLLTDRAAGLDAARAIHKIDPSYVIPPAILTRLIHRAKVPPERERVHTGWITRCEPQAQALDTLAALGSASRSVIPDLVKLTHRLCVHEHVVQALDQIGSPDEAQLAQISGGLQDKDPEARQAAVEYLAKSNPNEQTIMTLGRAMNDSNSGVRLSALQALEEIHPEGEGRLPLLRDFYKDPSPEIRERVIYMVGQMKPDSEASIPLLHEALKDPEPTIALTSAKILADINPQDELLITVLIDFMKEKGTAEALQAGQLLESLHIHEARVDAALEPYRAQQALWNRISSASSGTPPEQLAENSRTLKIDNLRIASSIIQDQPVHVARHFPADVGRLYCWTEVSIATAPAAIIHAWYRNGRLQHKEYLEVTAPQVHLWSSAAVRSGDWKVDVLPVGSNEPLATAVFSVSKSK